jgi:DNA-binding helix-hairpin-helix protein with protein kinase domain
MAQKLAIMLANPPKDEGKGGETEDRRQKSEAPSPEHPTKPMNPLLAWPTDLLISPDGLRRVVGFLMPRVSERRPLFTFYNPSARRQFGPLSNYRYLHRTGRNLAAAVRALHAAGCVIGDVNETNILASETALVTLIDCDSFQIRDPKTGAIYRCRVGRPEFTPPELLSADFATADRTPEHDRFGLAILLFQLLMEGTHPFAGIYQGKNDPPPYDSRIQAGHFVYGTRRVPYRPMPAAPPLEILHPDLRKLFLRTFEDGHHNPAVRPDADSWLTALEVAEAALLTCEANHQHRYGNHLAECPWCERTKHSCPSPNITEHPNT